MKLGSRHLSFDDCVFDVDARELCRREDRVRLQEKPARLLQALIEARGGTVRRRELGLALWGPDVHVDRDAGLNTAVRKLRAALRELGGPMGARRLETVPRVGYRLRVESTSVDTSAVPSAPVPAVRRPLWRSRALGVALIVGLGLFLPSAGPEASDSRTRGEVPRDDAVRGDYVEARSALARGEEERSRRLLEGVVAAEPGFAPAHAYLAEAAASAAFRSGEAETLARAREAGDRALELDPGLAVAWRARAMIAALFDWDLSAADRALGQARNLAPDDAVTLLAGATLASIRGRHDEAVAAVRRAVDLEPDSMVVRSDAGYFLLRAGRFEEAARACESVRRLQPDDAFAPVCLVSAFELGGDLARAREAARDLLRGAGAPDATSREVSRAVSPRRVVSAWVLAGALASSSPSPVGVASHYLVLGEKARALEWIERAAERREPGLVLFVGHPALRAMRGDPRLESILSGVGLGDLGRA